MGESKVNLLPPVTEDRIVRYNTLLEDLFGKGLQEYVSKESKPNLTKERKNILKLFDKYKSDEDYTNFKDIITRVELIDFETIQLMVYWYVHFLNKEGKATEGALVKGYKTVKDDVIVRLEDKKVYGVEEVYELEDLKAQNKLDFQEKEMVFNKNEEGNTYTLNFKNVKEGEYELGYTQFIDIKGKPINIYFEEDFLKEVEELSGKNRELLLIIIYGLKELKKAILKGYGYYKYEDARQINQSISDIRKNLQQVGSVDWVGNMVKGNKVLGWWV